MLKKLLNFYLFKKFRLPEINRKDARMVEDYDRLIANVGEYNQKYGHLMEHLIIRDPQLYNRIAELEAMSKTIEHLSDAIEKGIQARNNYSRSNLL